jgi:hypothetical protein
VLIGWWQYGWSMDLVALIGAAELFCGIVLVFVLEFLRHSDGRIHAGAEGEDEL